MNLNLKGKMSLSTESSDGSSEGTTENFVNKTPKLLSRSNKLEKYSNIVNIFDKSVLLAKIKNSHRKTSLNYAYKVHKLKQNSSKLRAPRSLWKKSNAKKLNDMSEDDTLPPLNKDKPSAQQDRYNYEPQDGDDDDLQGLGNRDDISLEDEDVDDENDDCISDDFLAIWTNNDIISIRNVEDTGDDISTGDSLDEYLFLEKQTEVDGYKLAGSNDPPKDEGNKNFRSIETSTDDLYQLRKLSKVSSKILRKCLELNQNAVVKNSYISGFKRRYKIPMGRTINHLPTIPEEFGNEEESEVTYEGEKKLVRDRFRRIQMYQDHSYEMLDIFKNQRKSEYLFPPRSKKTDPLWPSIKPFLIIAILGVFILIAALILNHYQPRRPVPPPKSYWRQYITNIIQLIYFYK